MNAFETKQWIGTAEDPYQRPCDLHSRTPATHYVIWKNGDGSEDTGMLCKKCVISEAQDFIEQEHCSITILGRKE